LDHKELLRILYKLALLQTRALTKISDNWEEWVEKTVERNPMGRTTTPEDVAGLVSLLLSDKADFVNCSTIFCDGGEHRSL